MITEKQINKIGLILFDKYGLSKNGWHFIISDEKKNSRNTFTFNQHNKTFFVYRRYTNLDENGIKNLFLSFIASYRVGFSAWYVRDKYTDKLIKEMGGDPNYNFNTSIKNHKWELCCPVCDKKTPFFSKPRVDRSCSSCNPEKYDEKYKMILKQIK